MTTLSLDLRERILASCAQREGTREEVARRLRSKLGTAAACLNTVRGIGYRFAGRQDVPDFMLRRVISRAASNSKLETCNSGR